MKKLKVLHVFATMNCGGAESRILDLYQHINDETEFIFVTLENKKHFYDDKIRELGGQKLNVIHPKDSVLKNFCGYYKIFKEEGPFDCVHAHTSYHSGIALLAAKLAKVKVRIVHARTNSTEVKTKLKKIYAWIGRKLIKFSANNFVAISREAGEYLFGKNEIPYTIIPNAFDYKKFLNVDISLQKDMRDKLELGTSKIIVHVGRFDDMKNQRKLVEFSKYLIEKKYDIKLVLVGDGKLKIEVEQLVKKYNISDYVVFLGLRKDVYNILAISDIFIMPSKYEGLGVAAIEAQAAQLPCILSDKIPKSANIVDRNIEFVGLNDNFKIWEKAYINLVQETRNEKQFVEQKFIEKKFTIEEEVKAIMKIYNREVVR